MKKSLSLLAAASATVALMPLAFAESSMSSFASSVAMSSSSSPSSVMMTGPCADKTGVDKVHCFNAESRKKNTDTRMDSARNSKKAAIKDACSQKEGLEKAACLMRIKKATMKKAEKMMEKMEKKMKPATRPMSQGAQSLCPGKRGTALALCVHSFRKTSSPLRNKSSSSASSMMSSSSISSSSSSSMSSVSTSSVSSN